MAYELNYGDPEVPSEQPTILIVTAGGHGPNALYCFTDETALTEDIARWGRKEAVEFLHSYICPLELIRDPSRHNKLSREDEDLFRRVVRLHNEILAVGKEIQTAQ